MTTPELANATTRAVEALGSLGQITRASEPLHFENGDYRYFYLKPNYGLGSSLLTSRELLVLIAIYSEAQTRTIRAVNHLLDQSEQGRLEPAMAIVLHGDPQGTRTLRDWGREQGLTLLPVALRRVLPNNTELENELCAGLYTHDPFDLAGPVRSSHQFFGRVEIPDTARRLSGGQVQALFGIRKAGKTSVLNRVVDEAQRFHKMSCTVADCSDDGISALSAGQLLNSIMAAIADPVHRESAGSYSNIIPLDRDVDVSSVGRTLLHTLTEARKPVLLALDEIDYISPSSPVAAHWTTEFNRFFRALRAVSQESVRRGLVFSVLLSGVSSRWFTVDSIEGIENSALAFVPETYLPPLERSQSIRMVETLGRAAGLVFATSCAEEVSQTCSDMPFWIRKAGAFINSCYAQDTRPVRLKLPDVRTLCDEFVEVEGGQLAFSSLRHLFRIFPELGPVAADAAHSRNLGHLPQDLVSILGRYGILGIDHGASGPLVGAGLRMWDEEQTRAVTAQSLEAEVESIVAPGSSSAVGEAEWAELLSEVSRLRNSLERKFRDFAVTVIRVECSSRPTEQKKPANVIANVLPSERRKNAERLSTSTLMKQLLWSELVAVITKNWRWFEKFFSDRKKFELYCDIINERPDAHAKEVDGADLALQRRAIEWVERAVDQSGVL